MEQRENQKQQSLFHGKFTQLVLSVSVFSLLFSRSYWLSLLHYCFTLNLHDTLPFQLFSHNIDKNCMFLLCNGLLVFLAKFSGFIGSSEHDNFRILDHDNNDDGDQCCTSFEDVPRFNQSIALENKAPLLQKDEALRNGTSMEETHEEDQEKDGEKWGLDILMENGIFVEDEDSKESSTDDELNKRFDEFIRKMKEELRIEAQRQLVMV
ncbi:hypothetical protein F3Y22_tig00110503pilonHSYRG00632 [Hibiscus syriacus]|uniref:Uncharacterized protein n=1 Tax=Hibiscus syriacus TaxID=106335 RepID=A0A6A3ABZ5_HIBSY|nr:uncharacterized protein LOC120129783 [Hibiscus syriacus]KAE8702041.1 hypothetical protein F3Y22_tig00110503pilonHSYRG00632 [Hibiscus syriacus]